jgi:hypothetical protein
VRLCDPPSRVRSAEEHHPGEGERWRRGQLAEQIAVRLDHQSGVTLFDDSLIAWYEPARAPVRVNQEWVLTQSGGLVDWLGDTGTCSDGAAALAAACRKRLLGANLAAGALQTSTALDPAELRRSFLDAFPGGLVYDPADPVPELFGKLSTTDRRLVILDAVAFARDFRESGRRSRFDVTACCVDGELRQIFLVERAGMRRARARWRAEVRRFNLETALQPR